MINSNEWSSILASLRLFVVMNMSKTIILTHESLEEKGMTDIYGIIIIFIFTGLLALIVNIAQEQNTVNILADFILGQ